MVMKTIAIVTAVMGVVLLASCHPAPQSTTPAGASGTGEGFAIYQTAQDIPVSQMPALSHVQLADKPLLSLADIVSYEWNSHEIKLTPEGAGKVDSLQVPVNGKAFVVCVDRQPIYWGAFWTLLSSASFDGVTIAQPLSSSNGATIRIGLGYPSSDFFRGEDPRSDPRIRKSLEEADRLVAPADDAATPVPSLSPIAPETSPGEQE